MFHKLQEGAIIVSDAHYSSRRPELLAFMQAIVRGDLNPPQLILLGDIFDALFGTIEYTYKENQEMIDLIERIAKEREVIYLEGNHDFRLKKVFSSAIHIYPLAQQPLAVEYAGKKVLLAHGDFDGKLGYKVYTAVIRNPVVLEILKYLDRALGHTIIKKIEAYLQKKEDCIALPWFKNFIADRFGDRFVCDFFIEGHFHQNTQFKLEKFTYINLAAFACNQRYFIVKSLQAKELLEEHQFSKEI